MTNQYTITKKIHRATAEEVFQSVVPCMHYDDCRQIRIDNQWIRHKGLSRVLRDHLSSGVCPRHYEEHMRRIEEIKNG